ncbi:putative P-loop containing nucleoside triphosphate hydrolase [Septoria linicola]|nr:putative P-loop containing nucleoside triphosphate hydrolase [Septoria linicola]
MPKGRRAKGKKPHRPANSPRHEDSAAASAAPHEDQAMGLPPRFVTQPVDTTQLSVSELPGAQAHTSFHQITSGEHSRQHDGHVINSGTNSGAITDSRPVQSRPRVLPPRPPNHSFLGWVDVLSRMKDVLLPPKDRAHGQSTRYALHGIGGVGKSEIVLQFLEQHDDKYWGIFWVDFSSVESANAGEPIRQVVYQLKIKKRPWLLVMDNCDKLEINYATYLRRNDTGAIISQPDCKPKSQVEIHGLDEQSAIQLLTVDLKVAEDMTSPRYSAAKAITDQLDCHSLAVTVAASFLSKSIYTIEEYTAKLEKTSTQKELLFERLTQNEPRHRTVLTTIEVSINELAIKDCIVDQCALELLSVLAFLDWSAVTEGLFSGAWSWGQKH